jgi:murein DD-endopeptidase MepM/ murein hydrolase activator NlpD
VTLDRAATLDGLFDGQPLTFIYETPTEAWALVGIPPWIPAGERALIVEARTFGAEPSRVTHLVPVLELPFPEQQIDVPDSLSHLLLPGLRGVEDEYLRRLLQQVSPQRLWDGPFGLPSAGVRTSPYGAARSYDGEPATTYHGGLDFAAPAGTAIIAPASGTVVAAEPLYIRGGMVILDHGAGVHTLYFHLSEISVVPGQAVARGELLGTMGSTGLSTGSHLHWEVRIGETFVDPDEWLTHTFP